jgi:limonene-1,2-epoxide hydrolase
MSNPINEVVAFFSEWTTPEQMRASFEARFMPETVWDNVGVVKTVGIEQALKFIDGFNGKLKVARAEVIIDFIAVTGNVVLNERSDNFYRADGSKIASVKAMGILEMDGPKIVAWREYFDTKGMSF